MIFNQCKLLKLFLNRAKFSTSVKNKSWKVLFFGNDEFSMYSLKELYYQWRNKKLLSDLSVVTTMSANPNPVQKFSSENDIKILRWPPKLNSSDALYDIGVVVSFGYLIPKEIINAFPLGMINVHASLLPRWRGASPIIYAIMNGDTSTGISIMRIKPFHFDVGEVVMQKSCSIGPHELMPSLHSRLGQMGADNLIKSIETLPECLVNCYKQNNAEVTYAPKIKSDIAQINWKEQSHEEVYNLYRALYGIHVLRTTWFGQLLKIKDVKIINNDGEDAVDEAGVVRWLRSYRQLRVYCKSGSVVIDDLTIGGKRLKSIDFYNGYLSKKPRELWKFI